MPTTTLLIDPRDFTGRPRSTYKMFVRSYPIYARLKAYSEDYMEGTYVKAYGDSLPFHMRDALWFSESMADSFINMSRWASVHSHVGNGGRRGTELNISFIRSQKLSTGIAFDMVLSRPNTIDTLLEQYREGLLCFQNIIGVSAKVFVSGVPIITSSESFPTTSGVVTIRRI